MCRVGVDGVLRVLPTTILIERLAGVWIHVEAGEVAAGDVDAEAVSALEDQRGRVQLDREFIGLSGVQQFLVVQVVAIAGPHDAIRDIQIHAVREIRVGRIDIDDLGGEVCVAGVRRGPDLHNQPASDLDTGLEGRRLEDDDVVAGGQRCRVVRQPEIGPAALVGRALKHERALRGNIAAQGGHRLARIEQVGRGRRVAGLRSGEGSAGMQVIRRDLGPGERPLVLVPPMSAASKWNKRLGVDGKTVRDAVRSTTSNRSCSYTGWAQRHRSCTLLGRGRPQPSQYPEQEASPKTKGTSERNPPCESAFLICLWILLFFKLKIRMSALPHHKSELISKIGKSYLPVFGEMAVVVIYFHQYGFT